MGCGCFFDKTWFWSFLVVSKTLLRTYNLTAADPICPPSTNNGRVFLISQGIITMNQFNQYIDFQHFQVVQKMINVERKLLKDKERQR